MIAHWFTQDEHNAIKPERLSKASLWHQISFIQDLDHPITNRDLLIISFERFGSQHIKKQLYQFSSTPSSALRIIDCGIFIQKHPEALLPILKEIKDCGATVLLLGAQMSFMRHQINHTRMSSII